MTFLSMNKMVMFWLFRASNIDWGMSAHRNHIYFFGTILHWFWTSFFWESNYYGVINLNKNFDQSSGQFDKKRKWWQLWKFWGRGRRGNFGAWRILTVIRGCFDSFDSFESGGEGGLQWFRQLWQRVTWVFWQFYCFERGCLGCLDSFESVDNFLMGEEWDLDSF